MNVVERLEELAEGAAPRPWKYAEYRQVDRLDSILYERVPGQAYAIAMQPQYDPAAFRTNAALIVAAVNALPDLLKLARAVVSTSLDCRRPRCARCDHKHHGAGACWGFGPVDSPCTCRLDAEKRCEECDSCVLVAALEPLLREVPS